MTRVFACIALLSFAAVCGCARQKPAAEPVHAIESRPRIVTLSLSQIDCVIWNPRLVPDRAFYVLKRTHDGFRAFHIVLEDGNATDLNLLFIFHSRPWNVAALGMVGWQIVCPEKQEDTVLASREGI